MHEKRGSDSILNTPTRGSIDSRQQAPPTPSSPSLRSRPVQGNINASNSLASSRLLTTPQRGRKTLQVTAEELSEIRPLPPSRISKKKGLIATSSDENVTAEPLTSPIAKSHRDETPGFSVYNHKPKTLIEQVITTSALRQDPRAKVKGDDTSKNLPIRKAQDIYGDILGQPTNDKLSDFTGGSIPVHGRVNGLNPHIILYHHQTVGRAWMAERENRLHGNFGGILADDMGLAYISITDFY